MGTKPQGKIHFTLLGNGLDFIASGLGRLKQERTNQDLKYAVLHISSGIELVLKERLRQEHWSLVFDDPNQAAKKSYETGNFTSVSFKGCVQRLKGVCGVTVTEKQETKLRSMRDLRNKLEHFGIVDSADAVESVVAEALDVLMDFIINEMNPEDLDKEEAKALEAIRNDMIALETFVTERLKTIRPELKKATTAVVTCPACMQEASILLDGARCLFCGYGAPPEEAADTYIAVVLGESQYRLAKEGQDWPRYMCPECETETLVDQGPGGNQFPADQYLCFACGAAWKEGDLDFCGLCGQPYNGDANEMTVCNDCFDARVRED